MTTEEFWELVGRAHALSPRDMKVKCDHLAAELRSLPVEEILSFDRLYTEFYFKAYSHDIWGAAFVINHGCSDDSFMDFRSTLISLGRAAYETACRNADDLADHGIEREWATYEGYQSVAHKVYEEATGCEMPEEEGFRHPREPSGISFNEWEMSKRFPKLVARYGYKDSSWLYLKVRYEKQESDENAADRLAELMLASGIIPSCGLIPPPRIVAAVLPSGHAPVSSGRDFQWEPFKLDEGHYWIATRLLRDLTPAHLALRTDLQGKPISLDLSAPGINDFDGWLHSLRERGLA